MLFFYVDGQAWLRRYVQGPGSPWLRSLFAPGRYIACAACGLIEVQAELLGREDLPDEVLAERVRQAEADWAALIHVHLTDETLGIARRLLRQYPLTWIEVLHLASAEMLKRRFVESDDRLVFVTSNPVLLRAAALSDMVPVDPAKGMDLEGL